MNTEKKLLLEKIVDRNKEIIDRNGGDINDSIKEIITLKYRGHSIWNPLKDETLREQVDPEVKYGETKINNFIDKYTNNY